MLSDFEDDIGEDLPSISLSQSTGEKVRQLQPAARIKPLDFLPGNVGSGITRSVLIAFQSVTEMPPAAEVASERARRAAAEQALRELREPPPAAAPPPPAPAPAAATPTTARYRAQTTALRFLNSSLNYTPMGQCEVKQLLCWLQAELVKAWLELRVDPEGGGGGGAGGGARARLLRELRARLGAAPGGAGAGGGAGVRAAGRLAARLPARARRGSRRHRTVIVRGALRAAGCSRPADPRRAKMLSGIILGLESTGGAKGTVAAAAWLLAVACTGGAGAGARAGGAAGARDARCTSC
ncbi:hypothetical protein MSG28_014029 [Choristoneura fumiferana]|uniref:Uncharacterized protein n=1 Tax=Choristoneura fumiferana TaxID=7141 RepID=A0ACC0JFP6_CHOFU|nr:hypothetical protein MSG28_014029 [Choristoneura fumiferana]